VCMPRSPTPASSSRPASLGVSMRPSVRLTTSALAGTNLSRLNHAACTLPVYASQRGSLRHHATLGAGWWPTFAGRDWIPAGLHRKVSEIMITSLPPFPGFAWRTSRDYRGKLTDPLLNEAAPRQLRWRDRSVPPRPIRPRRPPLAKSGVMRSVPRRHSMSECDSGVGVGIDGFP